MYSATAWISGLVKVPFQAGMAPPPLPFSMMVIWSPMFGKSATTVPASFGPRPLRPFRPGTQQAAVEAGQPAESQASFGRGGAGPDRRGGQENHQRANEAEATPCRRESRHRAASPSGVGGSGGGGVRGRGGEAVRAGRPQGHPGDTWTVGFNPHRQRRARPRLRPRGGAALVICLGLVVWAVARLTRPDDVVRDDRMRAPGRGASDPAYQATKAYVCLGASRNPVGTGSGRWSAARGAGSASPLAHELLRAATTADRREAEGPRTRIGRGGPARTYARPWKSPLMRHGEPEWVRAGMSVGRSTADRAGPSGRPGAGRAAWPADGDRGRRGDLGVAAARAQQTAAPVVARAGSRGARRSTGWPRSARPAGRGRRPRWSSGSSPRSGPDRSTSCGTGCPAARASATSTAGSRRAWPAPTESIRARRASPRRPVAVAAGRAPTGGWAVGRATAAPTPRRSATCSGSRRCRGNGSGSSRTTPRISVVPPFAIGEGHAFSLFRFSDVAHLPRGSFRPGLDPTPPPALRSTFDDLEVAVEDRGHVEADAQRPHRAVVEPLGRQVAQPLALGPRDRLGREAEHGRAARLHLAEHDGAGPCRTIRSISPFATAPVPSDHP